MTQELGKESLSPGWDSCEGSRNLLKLRRCSRSLPNYTPHLHPLNRPTRTDCFAQAQVHRPMRNYLETTFLRTREAIRVHPALFHSPLSARLEKHAHVESQCRSLRAIYQVEVKTCEKALDQCSHMWEPNHAREGSVTPWWAWNNPRTWKQPGLVSTSNTKNRLGI